MKRDDKEDITIKIIKNNVYYCLFSQACGGKKYQTLSINSGWREKKSENSLRNS